MKISPRDTIGFLKKPAPQARVILLYGPDMGLIQERAKTLGLTVLEDLNDPFNAITLTGEQVTEDPARLSDEANAMSMMGGQRLVMIKNSDDKITQAVKTYIEAPSPENLVIIEAGNLTPRSPLRKLCETNDQAAAIACYVEDERQLSVVIKSIAEHAGYRIQPDSVSWLAARLAGDRARARSEMDKLITYMGPAEGYKGEASPPVEAPMGEITLQDAQNCIGGSGEQSLDDLIYSITDGKPTITAKNYDILLQDGLPPIAMLRALQNHFRRLHLTKSRIATGMAPADAMKKLQPPVFFKQKQAFEGNVRRWSVKALEQVLMKLAYIEAQTKKTGTPVETLCGQFFLSLSKR